MALEDDPSTERDKSKAEKNIAERDKYHETAYSNDYRLVDAGMLHPGSRRCPDFSNAPPGRFCSGYDVQ